MSSDSPKKAPNEEAVDENSLAESKEQYKELKRKMRLLVYENEIFQQTLKATQRKLLKATQDKHALLDRLVEYEGVELSSSDDELTESSDEGDTIKPEPKKKKEASASNSSSGTSKQPISPHQTPNTSKKRKPSTPKASKSAPMQLQSNEPHSNSGPSTAESSKTLADSKSGNNNFSQHSLAADMFNDTFSGKSESNSMFDLDTSPNNIADDMISVDSIGK